METHQPLDISKIDDIPEPPVVIDGWPGYMDTLIKYLEKTGRAEIEDLIANGDYDLRHMQRGMVLFNGFDVSVAKIIEELRELLDEYRKLNVILNARMHLEMVIECDSHHIHRCLKDMMSELSDVIITAHKWHSYNDVEDVKFNSFDFSIVNVNDFNRDIRESEIIMGGMTHIRTLVRYLNKRFLEKKTDYVNRITDEGNFRNIVHPYTQDILNRVMYTILVFNHMIGIPAKATMAEFGEIFKTKVEKFAGYYRDKKDKLGPSARV